MAAKKKTSGKIFVLDTNVLLHDHKCLYNFEENDIIIPIVVLEELDKFKKGNDQINFQAREFVREMDRLSGEQLFTKGITLGKGHGRLFIETGKPIPTQMQDSFSENTPDHRILAITLHVNEKNPERQTILITKDINLRMKAKSLGLVSEDYESDKVKNIEILHHGVETFDGFDKNIIEALYQNGQVPRADFPMTDKQLPANQYVILKNASQSVLAWFDPASQTIRRIEKHSAFGIEPRNAEQTFSLHALLNPEVKLVSLTGKAGTGKTLLALAAALHQHKQYKQTLLARPIMHWPTATWAFCRGTSTKKSAPICSPCLTIWELLKTALPLKARN